MSANELMAHLVRRVYAQRSYTVEAKGAVLVAYPADGPHEYRRAETAAYADALRLNLGASAVHVRVLTSVEA